MGMRRGWAYGWCSVVVVAVMAVSVARSEDEREENVLVLKYAHGEGIQHPYHKIALKYKATIERTRSDIKVQIYPNGTLGRGRALFAALRAGEVDIAPIDGTLLERVIDDLEAYSLPFVIKDRSHWEAAVGGALSGGRAKALMSFGFVPMGVFYDGSRDLFAREPIRNLAELKGKRIGLPDDQLLADVWKGLGAKPQRVVDWKAVPGLLRQGKLDCVDGTVRTYLHEKLALAAPYYLRIQYIYSWHVLCLSKLAYYKTNYQQEWLLVRAAHGLVPYGRKQFGSYEDFLLKQVQGTPEVHPAVPVDLREWRRAARSVTRAYARKAGFTQTYRDIESEE